MGEREKEEKNQKQQQMQASKRHNFIDVSHIYHIEVGIHMGGWWDLVCKILAATQSPRDTK